MTREIVFPVSVLRDDGVTRVVNPDLCEVSVEALVESANRMVDGLVRASEKISSTSHAAKVMRKQGIWMGPP